MAKIDLNGDGGISVEEFVELNMRQDEGDFAVGSLLCSTFDCGERDGQDGVCQVPDLIDGPFVNMVVTKTNCSYKPQAIEN